MGYGENGRLFHWPQTQWTSGEIPLPSDSAFPVKDWEHLVVDKSIAHNVSRGKRISIEFSVLVYSLWIVYAESSRVEEEGLWQPQLYLPRGGTRLNDIFGQEARNLLMYEGLVILDKTSRLSCD